MPNRWLVDYDDALNHWLGRHPDDEQGPFLILDWVLDRCRHGVPEDAMEGPEPGEYLATVDRSDIDVVFFATYIAENSGIIRVRLFSP